MRYTFEGTGSGNKMKTVLNALAETLTGVVEDVKLDIHLDSGVDKEPLEIPEKYKKT